MKSMNKKILVILLFFAIHFSAFAESEGLSSNLMVSVVYPLGGFIVFLLFVWFTSSGKTKKHSQKTN